MPDFAHMVEEVIGLLNDWTGQQAQMCSLTAALTAADLTMVVDDGMKLVQGVMEVDEELVYVSGFDQPTGNATIPPWGRGQSGTAVTAHLAGARVTATPRPPRDVVKKRINQVILGLFPDLWGIAVDVQPADIRVEYQLPAAARWVIDVQWQTPALTEEWQRVRGWRLNTNADPGDFPTGVSVTIPGVPIGQPIRTVYAGEPQPLVNPTDDFAATTGLHTAVADLVVVATASRLVLGQELSRGQLATVEQSQRTEKVSTGASMAASRFLRQEYDQQVTRERRRLLATHPTRPHFEGV